MTKRARRSPWARLWRIAAGLLGTVLILAALLLGALRLGLALLPDNVQRVQAWLEEQTGLRVEVADLDARMRMFGPEIVLRNVTVMDQGGEQALFRTREGSVGLDLLSLFKTGDIVAGRIRFVGPSVTIVRLEDGRIRLLGLKERPASESDFDLDRLPAGIVEIVEASVLFRDDKTGRGPWRLDALDLTLERHHDAVAVSGSARLPETIGAGIRFEGSLEGSLREPESLNISADVSTDRLNLVGVADFLPGQFAQPLAGFGPVSAVLVVENGQLRTARLRLDVENAVLEMPPREPAPVATLVTSEPYREPGSKPMSAPTMDMTIVERPAQRLPRQVRYERLSGRVRLRQEGEQWVFAVRDLVTVMNGVPAAAANLQGQFRGNPRTTFAMQLSAGDLKLAPFWPLVLAFAPAGFDRWSGLDPQGEIVSLNGELVRERAGAPPDFQISAEVEGFSLRPTGRLPGIAGISAKVSGTEQQGMIALRGRQASFSFPRMFREPLQVDSASSNLTWRRDGRAWILATPLFELEQAANRAQGSLEFQFERGAISPRLTLDAQVQQAELADVRRYVPVGRLQPRTVVWLEQAFGAGRVHNGKVNYHGPVRNFPFEQGEGDFRASAEIQGATLNYYDGFPPITQADGLVEFHNESTQARVQGGRVGALQLTSAECLIADYRAPVIEVDAAARGDLESALDTVKNSPLAAQLGNQFQAMTGQGPADYQLRLKIATGSEADPYYRVIADLKGATLGLPFLNSPLQKVKGRLEIEGLRVQAPSLSGELLGGPFELTLEPRALRRGVSAAIDLHGRGRAAGSQLPPLIGLPTGIGMKGTAAWTLDGHLERQAKGEQWPTQLQVRTDLSGVEISAPRPLGKRAEETRDTVVSLLIPASGRTDVNLETGSARAALRFERGAGGKWNLDRGMARFDGEPVTLPARTGLQVAGNWPDFELGEWLALRSTEPGQRALADWLGNVDVHLDRARVFGFEFDDVGLKLSPGPAAWEAYVSGPMADGRITIPDDTRGGFPIVLEMGRLELRGAGSDAAGSTAEDRDPRTLPALLVRAQELLWESRRFGWLQADVVQTPDGLRLSRLATQSPHFNLRGTGAWTIEGDGSRTQLDLEFRSDDLAQASRALDYRDAVEAKKAFVRASLNWSGGPSSDALARMNGTLKLELDHGRITTVEPGAGRVLGLLSVAALPRRLALDFRDVTETGLAFDTVRGDFDVRSGSAYTGNLLLKGPAVDIGIAGRTGIAGQDYDQTVVVSGNPTGPLAVAGALAAGPVIGAGVLVLSQLFKGQLQGLTRAYYRVTGPWSDPVVQRISASEQPALDVPGERQPPDAAPPEGQP